MATVGPRARAASATVRREAVLVVVVAFLTAVPVVRGKLQLLDVVCLVLMPFLLAWAARDRRLLLLMLTLPLWGVGQLVADEVNGLGPRPSLQVAAALTLLALVPALMWLGRRDLRRMCLLQAGIAAGTAVGWVVVEHVPVGSTAGWKYALDVPVALTLVALADVAWHGGRRLPSLAALGGVAVLGMATDSRHLAAVAGLTAVLVLVPFRPPGTVSRRRLVATLATGALLLGALSGAFLQGAGSGLVGERTGAQVARYGSDPFSFLVNVRPEMFQELFLFLQRPSTGWGSEPHMDSVTFARSLSFLRSIGVRRDDIASNWTDLPVPGVAAHSTAVDSIMRAGAAAVPFWTLATVVAVWAGVSALLRRLSPLVVLWTMLVVWNMFFEPMTARYHLELGAYLALALTVLWTTRRGKDGTAGAPT